MRGGVLVYVAGSRYDNVRGTDRSLAEALSVLVHVLWVDPPQPVTRRGLRGPWPPIQLSRRTDTLSLLRTLGPPGAVARSGSRQLAAFIQDAALRRLTRRCDVRGTIVASPMRRAPRGVSGPLMYYVTDDWPGGAQLMGLAPRLIERVMRENITAADCVAAVSPGLAEDLSASCARPVDLLPNGCRVPTAADGDSATPSTDSPESLACLVGQLNERLDLGLLEALSDHGVPVLVAGPKKVRDAGFERRLDRWLARPGVTWLGEVPASDVASVLGRARVGLTPYARSSFNRASFPLKTLEYLAHGLGVVSTDLPYARWLDTEHVAVATGAGDFVERVEEQLRRRDHHSAAQRRDFAQGHSWDARARRALELLEAVPTARRLGTSSRKVWNS